MKKLEAYVINALDNKLKPRNIIQATNLSTTLRKLGGVAVYTHVLDGTGNVKSVFSCIGFFCYVFWCSIHIYCGYVSVVDNQTILRKLYNTKLQAYGDKAEWSISTMYMVYTLWKVPFSISGSPIYIQAVINIDNVIRELNENVDYIKCSSIIILSTMGQILIGTFHMFSLWVILASMSGKMPYELMYQVVVGNSLALMTTSHYCFYMFLLKDRYAKINNIISNVNIASNPKSPKSPKIPKSTAVTDKSMCETLRTCARLYAMVSQAVRAANKVFGLAIVLTMGIGLLSIILNLFYLMEATAGELFKTDLTKYTYLFIYLIWEIIYSISIIFLNIMFCEKAKKAVSNI